jgi:hypothetical protein
MNTKRHPHAIAKKTLSAMEIADMIFGRLLPVLLESNMECRELANRIPEGITWQTLYDECDDIVSSMGHIIGSKLGKVFPRAHEDDASYGVQCHELLDKKLPKGKVKVLLSFRSILNKEKSGGSITWSKDKRSLLYVLPWNTLFEFVIQQSGLIMSSSKLYGDICHEAMHILQGNNDKTKYTPATRIDRNDHKRLAKEYFLHPTEVASYAFGLAGSAYFSIKKDLAAFFLMPDHVKEVFLPGIFWNPDHPYNKENPEDFQKREKSFRQLSARYLSCFKATPHAWKDYCSPEQILNGKTIKLPNMQEKLEKQREQRRRAF